MLSFSTIAEEETGAIDPRDAVADDLFIYLKEQVLLLQSGGSRLDSVADTDELTIYLLSLMFNLQTHEAAAISGRDRVFVRDSLQAIEERRDDPAFDRLIDDLAATIQGDKAERRIATQLGIALPALTDAATNMSELVAQQRDWLAQSEATLERLERESAQNQSTASRVQERYGV